MKTLVATIMICWSVSGSSQPSILSEEAFEVIIKKYHPVLKQASLDVQIAEAGITASRGKFDPVLNAGNAQKKLDGLGYYNQSQTEIKIPTWYGIDLYAGKESLTGSRLNPEETKGTIHYVGVNLPLLQNLLMDKRRATLQQAKIFRDLTLVQQKTAQNNLLQEALIAYWEWWEAYHNLQLVIQAQANAGKRFMMVKTAYRLGDRPAIDTLEALTQLQSFGIRQSEAYMQFQNKGIQLSTFLWTEKEVQYELPAAVMPQDWKPSEMSLLDGLLFSARSHPELRVYEYKLATLKVDRQLKFQELLPQVNLKYQQLGRDVSATFKNAWFENDYRFGISLSVPLRLSEGRGSYRQAKLKLAQAALEQTNKRVQILAKVKQAYVEWQQTNEQARQQESLVNSTISLQKGEELRFSGGESSVFLMNARELKSIEMQQKLIEIKSKTRKALIKLNGAAGLYGG